MDGHLKPPVGEEAPPQRRLIPLGSINRLCGGLGLLGLTDADLQYLLKMANNQKAELWVNIHVC
jgi:hypothetical protein